MTNFLLITVDDMNYNSPTSMGNAAMPDLTPNMDALVRQSLYFRRGHVTVAICMPSRESIMTGCYPHNYGGRGDFRAVLEPTTLAAMIEKDDVYEMSQVRDWAPVAQDVPTLTETLKARGGYVNGWPIIGKRRQFACIVDGCDGDDIGEVKSGRIYIACITVVTRRAYEQYITVLLHDVF